MSPSFSVDPAVCVLEIEQLPLFSEMIGLGVDVASLRRSVADVQVAQRAPRTSIELHGDWKQFSIFVRSLGRRELPATSDTVQLYVAWALDRNKVSTVRRRLWAVTTMHRQAGHRSPIDDAVRDLVKAAARKKKEPVDQATALSAELLGRVCAAMPETAKGARDRAMLLIGFGAALRRSEIVDLQLDDVVLRPGGIAVHIRSAKTDQTGQGATISVFAGKRPTTDPVRALRAWLRVRGKEPGPLFQSCVGRGVPNGRGLKDGQVVNRVLAEGLRRVGVDPSGYSGHSLRAGPITAALQNNVPESVVMRQLSRHRKSDTLLKYVRKAQEFSLNPLARVL